MVKQYHTYLVGWAQAVIYYPASIAAAAAIFLTQFLNLFGIEKNTQYLSGHVLLLQ